MEDPFKLQKPTVMLCVVVVIRHTGYCYALLLLEAYRIMLDVVVVVNKHTG